MENKKPSTGEPHFRGVSYSKRLLLSTSHNEKLQIANVLERARGGK